jgi:hypothetical protein
MIGENVRGIYDIILSIFIGIFIILFINSLFTFPRTYSVLKTDKQVKLN